MRVIRCGEKKENRKGRMTDHEVILAYHELEEQLGLRPRNSALKLLDIPVLSPTPMSVEEQRKEGLIV